jgi:hypothetical protein
LHLNDERRIYGWPEEWPSDPRAGYFSIAEAEWIEAVDDEEGKGCNKRIPLLSFFYFGYLLKLRKQTIFINCFTVLMLLRLGDPYCLVFRCYKFLH